MSPCPRASAVTPGLKHPWSALGAQRRDLQRLPDGERGVGGAPWPVRRPGGQQREAWTDEELRGAGESGARGQFLQVLAESGGGSDRGSPGRTARDPSLTRDPSARQPAPAAAKLLGHPHPLPPGADGFLESPGFARPPARPRILCPAALERLLEPGTRGQEGAPGRRRVVGKGGDDRHRQLEYQQVLPCSPRQLLKLAPAPGLGGRFSRLPETGG